MVRSNTFRDHSYANNRVLQGWYPLEHTRPAPAMGISPRGPSLRRLLTAAMHARTAGARNPVCLTNATGRDLVCSSEVSSPTSCPQNPAYVPVPSAWTWPTAKTQACWTTTTRCWTAAQRTRRVRTGNAVYSARGASSVSLNAGRRSRTRGQVSHKCKAKEKAEDADISPSSPGLLYRGSSG